MTVPNFLFRFGPAFGGPGFGPRSQETVGVRSVLHIQGSSCFHSRTYLFIISPDWLVAFALIFIAGHHPTLVTLWEGVIHLTLGSQ